MPNSCAVGAMAARIWVSWRRTSPRSGRRGVDLDLGLEQFVRDAIGEALLAACHETGRRRGDQIAAGRIDQQIFLFQAEAQGRCGERHGIRLTEGAVSGMQKVASAVVAAIQLAIGQRFPQDLGQPQGPGCGLRAGRDQVLAHLEGDVGQAGAGGVERDRVADRVAAGIEGSLSPTLSSASRRRPASTAPARRRSASDSTATSTAARCRSNAA